jgi:hypothetical protein
MKSFNALIFAGCFAISAVVLGAFGVVPITTRGSQISSKKSGSNLTIVSLEVSSK